MNDGNTTQIRPELFVIPELSDNYCYVCHYGESALVVDPAEADPVMQLLEGKALKPEMMLVTHGHADHTGGCRELERKYGVTVAAVSDGMRITFGGGELLVIHTPGHTTDHYCYFLSPAAGEPMLFAGDTLFGGGCGRVNGGQYAQMWDSLLKLRALPPETQVCFGHEYTLDNLAFAQNLEPDNPHVRARLVRERVRLGGTGMTAPSTMRDELLTNPFLRADDPVLQVAADMNGADPLEVFTFLRRCKNDWG